MAAILAARSTMLSAAAGDAWQKTLRVELQRTAALLIDVRQVYGAEGDVALMILQDEILADELRDAAAVAAPDIATILAEQAQIHADAAGFLAPNVILAADEYRQADGSIDLEGRLADLRGQTPDMVALDPDSHARSGDQAQERATGVMTAALPLGAAFLLGALAMPLPRRRRMLVILGWTAVVVAAVMAVTVELAT